MLADELQSVLLNLVLYEHDHRTGEVRVQEREQI
jgi:hypothetical protein